MKISFYCFLLLILPLFIACENEPIGQADPSKVIQVNSDLYGMLQRAAGNDFENEITCIDFHYSFTLVIYDENMTIERYKTIGSDIEFSEFLGALEEGKSISLSYPITSVLEDGQHYTINNNEELKEAIDRCIVKDAMINCTNILTETSCIWKIEHLEGPNGHYSGSYFEVSSSGNAALFTTDNTYAGTWVTYAIENELHLNIFLIGEGQTNNNWNYDWKIVEYTESTIEIDNGIDNFLLTKDCYEPCRKILFEECEMEPGSGTAVFDLESYFSCYFTLTHILDVSTVSWNYYLTTDDLLAGTNAIEELMYVNTENPQIIYIRFNDLNTGAFIEYIAIVVKAVEC